MTSDTRDPGGPTGAPSRWIDFWRRVSPLTGGDVDSALRQVGKTMVGEPVPHEHLDLIVATIIDRLDLTRSDVVTDLGCGNGLLTERISRVVDRIDGIDVSAVLIEDARRYRVAPNVSYRTGDLTDPSTLGDPQSAKWYAYEVLQHVTPDDLAGLLAWMRSRDIAVFLAGSVPDAARIGAFYDTPERWDRYLRRREAGTEQIGTWWSQPEIARVATKSGFDAEFLAQEPALYTAHYRFDVRFTPG